MQACCNHARSHRHKPACCPHQQSASCHDTPRSPSPFAGVRLCAKSCAARTYMHNANRCQRPRPLPTAAAQPLVAAAARASLSTHMPPSEADELFGRRWHGAERDCAPEVARLFASWRRANRLRAGSGAWHVGGGGGRGTSRRRKGGEERGDARPLVGLRVRLDCLQPFAELTPEP